MDASTIDLCLAAFPWASFRRTKGAIKLHVGLDQAGHLPTFISVTDGKAGQTRICARAAAILANLHALAETDPEALSSADFLILMVNSLAARAGRGESTTLDPRQVSILVDGAVELLDQAAAAALDEEAERAAVLEQELASRKSATLH